MNASFDQQDAHSALSVTGSRQAGHSGGSATSSAMRQPACTAPRKRASRAGLRG